MLQTNSFILFLLGVSTYVHLTLAAFWKPAPGISFNYQLQGTVGTDTKGFQVWDIDLFDTPVITIDSLKAGGAKVICYFSAGSYENWRNDSSLFQPSDLGNNLEGWPGEKWLNLSSPNVHSIMLTRLDKAVEKHCDGVDPDNVDGYDNDNGLDLSQQDSIDYMTFLSDAAHNRSLAIGLKNAGDIIPSVINMVEWSVNEQCAQYSECDTYEPFIAAGKPVLHVEYPKSDTNNNNNVSTAEVNKACDAPDAGNFSTVIKNLNLDAWYQTCGQNTQNAQNTSSTANGAVGLRPNRLIRQLTVMFSFLWR